jgi:hypothetical protein
MKTPQKKVKTTQTIGLDKTQSHSLKKYYYLFGILAFFLFANTIGNDYNMDDGLVTRNHKLTSQGLSAIKEIFTSSYYDDGVYAYGYRPMVHLSFALEHELFGEKPGAGHFINTILFALSVVLFFKLLVKWVGEKNVLFAGIATLLFTVHPIHTEVVASLKNRDEILAFLFVIWAGLSAHKFLEKGKWISLISIVILFVLAMLSKKSVYPMAIVLPMAIILSKAISVKQLIQIVVALVIPAGLIGADFQWIQTIVMTVIPLGLIAFVYLLKQSFLVEGKEGTVRAILSHWIIPTFFIILITAATIYTHTFWLICFTIPFLIWLCYVNFYMGVLCMILLLVYMDLEGVKDRILIFILLIGVGYSYFLYHKGVDIKKWGVLAGITIVYFLLRSHSLLDFFYLLAIIGFFVLVYKKLIWSIILICIAGVNIYFINDKINVAVIVILFFSISLFFEKKINSFPWSAIVPISVFLGFVVFQSYKDYQTKNETISVIQEENKEVENSQKPKETDSFLKEGRTLLYVENTLIAPHTSSEKIATGFTTLGQYLSLHVFPNELLFYYGFSKTKTTDFTHYSVWISVIIHLLMLGIAIWQIKKRSIITIGVVWYFLSILLFSNWVELVAGMVGERLAFTASAGFSILITGILFWIKPDFELKKPGIVGAILGISVLLFTGRTIVRNTNWKNSLTLMGHDMKQLSNSAQANNLYAMSLMAESVKNKSLSAPQKLEMQRTAISHFDQATTVWADFYNAYIDKAKATMLTGDYQKGLEALEQAKRVDPKNVLTDYVLLEITERNGDYKTYLKSAEALFQITQNDHAYGVVARGHFLLNNYQKSKEVLLEGIKKHPESEVLKNNLRIVEEKMK